MASSYTPEQGAAPEPAKFGLLNSKTLVTTTGRWSGGIALDSLACNVSTRIVDICGTNNEVEVTEPGDSNVLFRPYNIESSYECSTMGFKNQDYFAKARLGLELCQNKAAEAELWTGALAKQDDTRDAEGLPNPNRYLASPDAEDVTPTTGTAVKPAYGLALLEEAIGQCGCGSTGYIHATRAVGSTLPVRVEGDTLVTKLGNYVIAGTGYTGTGPDGSEPTGSQVWMYATGQITARVGDISVTPDTLSEATNTRNNTVTVTASRDAAVTWDGCCHYAVLVDLSLDYS